MTPHSLFGALGLQYIGPVDGHDITALEAALERAKTHGAPVVVHCITRKGLGYAPAEQDEEDHLHGIGTIDPRTGRPLRPAGLTWSAAFGRELVELADTHPDVVAITAAMPGSVGLNDFAARYPARFFDVGIAEQHAVASAAGMAMAGLHPVIALYGTFLNRALDQVLMDLALHRLGATLVLDRSGVTGDDGPSHNGLWDLAMLQAVPGLRIAAPAMRARCGSSCGGPSRSPTRRRSCATREARWARRSRRPVAPVRSTSCARRRPAPAPSC